MSARGFLKDTSGVKRLRLVKSGYDADDFSTPPNAVIFDSEAGATLPIFRSGIYNLTSNKTGVYIDSWTSLGYTPLFMFGYSKGGISTNFLVMSASTYLYVYSRNDGVMIDANALSYPLQIHYTVFRRPIT